MEVPMRFEGLPNGAIALLFVSAALACAAPADAQYRSILNGSYLALSGGVVGLEDADIDYGGALPNGRVRFDSGWAVSGAAGWRVLRLYRLELEVSHRDNDVTDVDGFRSGGSMTSTTYMVNGYVDIPALSDTGVLPYIGGGVGRAQFTHDLHVDGFTLAHSDSHAFAYQVIGGLEFPLIPRRMSATFEYRYLGTTRPLFQDQGGFFYHSDYDSHTFLAGLRWGF
jgi:opacity protein-like surface antigen